MKKLLFLIAVLLLAATAKAQMYVGGNVGIASYDNGDSKKVVYSLLPEVGYTFNENWAAGVVVGWSKGNLSSQGNLRVDDDRLTRTFEISPYARYTFLNAGPVDIFCDCSAGYRHYNGDGDQLSIGLKPGLSLNLNGVFSVVAHVGFIGFQEYNPSGNQKSVDVWGMDFDSNNISLGVYYNF